MHEEAHSSTHFLSEEEKSDRKGNTPGRSDLSLRSAPNSALSFLPMRERESQGTGPQDKNQLRRGPQGCWGWASPGGSHLEWHRALQHVPGMWVLDLQCLNAGQWDKESLAASSGTKGQVTRTGLYPHTLLQSAQTGVEERCPVSSYNKGKSWGCSAS